MTSAMHNGKQVAADYDNGDGRYKERWDGMTGDERGRGGRDGDDVRPFYSRERTLRARNVTGAKRCRGTSAGRCETLPGHKRAHS